jgi:hypothetical protein
MAQMTSLKAIKPPIYPHLPPIKEANGLNRQALTLT